MEHTHPDELAYIAALYKSGCTYSQIAAQTGRCTAVICRAIKLAGIPRYAGNRKYKLDAAYFHTIDTPDKAYWLGFIAADGCILSGKNKQPHRLNLTMAIRDESHLELFRDCLKTDIPLKNSNNQTAKRLNISNVEMVLDLVSHGISPRKSHFLLPWEGPTDLLRHYWRGVWDGDGCLVANGQMQLVGSMECMRGFAAYAKTTLGIDPGRLGQHKSIWDVRYWRKGDVALLAAHLYEDANVALARKAELAIQFAAWKPKPRVWADMTSDHLLCLKKELGTWKAVARKLGKSYSVITCLRKSLGI